MMSLTLLAGMTVNACIVKVFWHDVYHGLFEFSDVHLYKVDIGATFVLQINHLVNKGLQVDPQLHHSVQWD